MLSHSIVSDSLRPYGLYSPPSPPGSSVRGIFQARVLEWGAITFSISLSPEKMKYRTLFGTSVNRNNLDTFQFSSCLSQGYCLHRRRGLEVPSPFPEHLLRFLFSFPVSNQGEYPLQGSVRALLRGGICQPRQHFFFIFY